MAGPYHEGELAMQRRAGVRDRAERIGHSIHGAIPPPARAFLDSLRFAVVASLDRKGRVWASPLVGAAGGFTAATDRELRVTAAFAAGDPLQGMLDEGASVALLAIDFATRRRMRLNGRVAAAGPHRFAVTVAQVYSNCPKYIHRRVVELEPAAAQGTGRHLTEIGDAEQRLIRAADTFFVGTYHEQGGADCSHRGGAPGFVAVDGVDRLVWPDYAGNSMFQTLGNIGADGRAGVLFVDFRTGDTLALTGAAGITWDDRRIGAFAGAERLVELRIESGMAIQGAFPRFSDVLQYSPFTPS